MQPQYVTIANILSRRIRHGDYLINEIPSSRKLAEEMGVSHIVARKAAEKLLDEGLLTRDSGGKLAVANGKNSYKKTGATIAMLCPAFNSGYFYACRIKIENIAKQLKCMFRPVNYIHWDDPVIKEVVNGFDGVFLLGSSEPINDMTISLLTNSPCKVVTFDMDLTSHGIPRLAIFDSSHIRKLLEHLLDFGHQRIDCINTQPYDDETGKRIEEWVKGCSELKFQGQLHNEPVEQYQHPTPKAYEIMSNLLLSGRFNATAVYCTNEYIAYGVIRALEDFGIEVGKEVSVCAIGDASIARYYKPSITCLEMPEIDDFLVSTIQWMGQASDAAWEKEMNNIVDAPLFAGESTGRPVKFNLTKQPGDA